MKKLRLIASILALSLLFALNINSVQASSGLSIYLDDEKQSYSNQAVLENGRTLLPLRGIFESLGAHVQWDQKTQTIHASNTNTNIFLKIGSKNATVNGITVTLDVPPKVKNGRTLVPLRFISESLGANVQWESSSKSVYIKTSMGTGNLKGSVTWQYNYFIGTKADVGADVFLIPRNFNPNSVSKSELDLYVIGGSSLVPNGSNLHYAKVNGFGQYELNNIPAGQYVVLISSKNTTRNFTEPISPYLESVLKPLFGNSYDGLKTMQLNLNKSTMQIIEIEKDRTLDISKDFGFTWI